MMSISSKIFGYISNMNILFHCVLKVCSLVLRLFKLRIACHDLRTFSNLCPNPLLHLDSGRVICFLGRVILTEYPRKNGNLFCALSQMANSYRATIFHIAIRISFVSFAFLVVTIYIWCATHYRRVRHTFERLRISQSIRLASLSRHAPARYQIRPEAQLTELFQGHKESRDLVHFT